MTQILPRSLPPLRLALPFLAFIGLAVLWSAYWAYALSEARARVADWRAERAAAGQDIACDGERWGGYPFRIEVHCDRFALSLAGTRLAAADVTVMAQAYDLRHLIALADGPLTVTPQGADAKPLTLAHESAIMSLLIGRDGRMQADAMVTRLSASSGLTIASAEFHALSDRRAASKPASTELTIAADLQSLVLPEPVLGIAALDSASLQGGVADAPWPIPGNAGRALGAAAARATSAELTRFDLKGGGMAVTAAGRARVEADGTLSGKFPARVVNLDALLGHLAQAGIIPPEAREAGGLLLGLLGGKDPEGVKTDLEIARNELRLGPFPLGPLPLPQASAD